MFTGIVGQIGTVAEIHNGEPVRRLWIESVPIGALKIGDSVSVNGACLTAVEIDGDTVRFDLVGETLQRTNLGDLNEGDPVNLERAMAANGRFEGHVVQGHIDGVGELLEIHQEAGGRRLRVSIPEILKLTIVQKGSVAVDGVSLTVADVADDHFDVVIIPHTIDVTILGLRKVGDTVNLEGDVIAKYVERLLRVGT